MTGDAIQRLQEEMKENPEYLTAWLLQRLKFGLWTDSPVTSILPLIP